MKNLRTDHLDLWQVHDVRTEEDVNEIFSPGGAIEAFVAAREKGMTRFIGVTGHHDPEILRHCLDLFPFDTVLIPVNPAESYDRSFIDGVIPSAQEKGMGIIAMKTYLRGLATRLPTYRGMEPFFRFALSQSVSLAVIGCDDVEQLEENVRLAARFTAMTVEEMEDVVASVGPYTGQLTYYKP